MDGLDDEDMSNQCYICFGAIDCFEDLCHQIDFIKPMNVSEIHAKTHQDMVEDQGTDEEEFPENLTNFLSSKRNTLQVCSTCCEDMKKTIEKKRRSHQLKFIRFKKMFN